MLFGCNLKVDRMISVHFQGKPFNITIIQVYAPTTDEETEVECSTDTGFNLWVGKIPCRRAWQSTLVFLPGESPWTEQPGKLQSIGSQRVGSD